MKATGLPRAGSRCSWRCVAAGVGVGQGPGDVERRPAFGEQVERRRAVERIEQRLAGDRADAAPGVRAEGADREEPARDRDAEPAFVVAPQDRPCHGRKCAFPGAGRPAPRRPGARRGAAAGLLAGVDLVEHAAVGEVRLLRLGPAAEHLVDGEQARLRELLRVLLGDLRIDRPVEVLRRDLLAFRRVEVLEIGLRDGARAAAVDGLVDDARPAARRGSRSADRRCRTCRRRTPSSTGAPRSPRSSSTSPTPRSAKVTVEPRAPESSTGTLANSLATKSLALASLPPGCFRAKP